MKQNSGRTIAALAAGVAALILNSGALAQSATGAAKPPSTPAAAPSASPSAPSPATANKGLYTQRVIPHSQRGEWYYAGRYGVDHLQVRAISSGISLEFRYRVLNPDKAHLLGQKDAKPALVDWKTGTKLTVPTMEKIGQLRQMTKLEQGREYWMVFANPNKLVKKGDRVDLVVGPVHLDGLIVE